MMPAPYSRLLKLRVGEDLSPPTTSQPESFIKSKVFPFRSKPSRNTMDAFSRPSSSDADSSKMSSGTKSGAGVDGENPAMEPSSISHATPYCRSMSNPQAIPTSPHASPDSSSSLGLPHKVLRNIRDNLQRGVSKLTHVRHSVKPSDEAMAASVAQDAANERSSTSKKAASKQRSLEESQFEVAYRIARYLAEVFKGTKEPSPLFVGEKEPPISFLRYVERLIKLTNKWVEEADGPDSFGVRCAILAVDYLERIDVKLGPKAIHRYYMAAYLIGIKLLYDYYISNSFWAEVSGCPRAQVNLMEVHVCNSLNWDFCVPEDRHHESLRKFLRRPKLYFQEELTATS